jgi:hypothetical protein
MWKVSKGLILGVMIIPLLTGIGFLIAGLLASPEVLGEDGFSLKNQHYFMGASFILFPSIILAGILLYYKLSNDRVAFLLENGIQGVAEILSRQQTGVYINELPQVKFLLQVTLPGREPYKVEHKNVVSMLDLGSINVGAKLPVFVDPNNEKNILLNP